MRHTPYDGSAVPFTIGLRPLDPADWIDLDARAPDYLKEKSRLIETAWDVVYRGGPETGEAQGEVLDLLLGHLTSRFPERFEVAGDAPARTIKIGGRSFLEKDWSQAPLGLASLLVQDDLVLMRRTSESWVLAAGCVCFPSFWSLADKYGRSMEGVHAPVPGVNETLGARIIRIFDNLAPGKPVYRQNWSLTRHKDLHQPSTKNEASPDKELTTANVADHLYLRIEHQTLRKLEQSGDLLFTIKVLVDPLRALENHTERQALAAGLHKQLEALDPEQRAYKDLGRAMSPVLEYLEGIS